MTQFENVVAWMIAGGHRDDHVAGDRRDQPGRRARMRRLVDSLTAGGARAVRRQAAADPSCCPA